MNNFQMCTGYGQSDSHAIVLNDGRDNPHPSAGAPYDTINIAGIAHIAANPPSTDKAQAQWVIASAYHEHDARAHARQREVGSFGALVFDIDSGNPTLDQVTQALDQCLSASVGRLIYSTSGATEAMKKWRGVIPLESPLTGAEFCGAQASLFDALEHLGLILDRSLERAAQVFYLPNRGEYYEWRIGGYETFNARHHPMWARVQQYIEVQAAIERDTGTSDRDEGARSYLRAFREKHTIAELLALYGYTQKGGTDHWRSPYQSGQSYATKDNGDHWYSLSDSDAAAGLGRSVAKGGRYGDAFDLYIHFNCNGNRQRAEAYAKQCLQEEDDARYGDATAEMGESLWVAFLNHQEELLQRRVEEEKKAHKEAEQFEQAAKEAEANKWRGAWQDDVPFDVAANALEWAAWHAPGVIGQAVRIKSHQATRKSLVPLLAGALSAICYLTQGKLVLRYKHFVTPSSLMTFMIGDTGAGKGDAINMFYDIIRLAPKEVEKHILCEVMRSFASGEAVTDFMANKTSHVFLLQAEAGALRSANKGSNRHEHVAAELTDIFTAFVTGVEGTHAKTQGLSTKSIHNPTIGTLFLSTPSKLFKTIEGADAESGWLGRYLFLPMPKTRQNEYTERDIHYPIAVSHYIARLAGLLPPAPNAEQDPRIWDGVEHKFHAIFYSPEAEETMRKVDNDFDEKVVDPKYSKLEQALYSRAAETASRLSFVAGLASGVDEHIHPAAVQWARVVTQASVEYVTSRMEHTLSGDEDDSPATKIRNSVRDYFVRAARDQAFMRGFGPSGRVNQDGEIELARSRLKIRLKESALKRVKIGSRQVNEELDAMIEEEIIVSLGKDLNGREWLRYVLS